MFILIVRSKVIILINFTQTQQYLLKKYIRLKTENNLSGPSIAKSTTVSSIGLFHICRYQPFETKIVPIYLRKIDRVKMWSLINDNYVKPSYTGYNIKNKGAVQNGNNNS